MEHYLSLNTYARNRFGHKLYKLALDGGFTCPGRDGTLGTRGCIFCSSSGSGDFAESTASGVDPAIDKAIARVSSKSIGAGYIAYFQNFTNTYASYEKLKQLFTSAIENPNIEVLAIATRPDCLPDETVSLLSELNRSKPVWVELGLQTIHPQTAEYIRRGYLLSVYDDAVNRLKSAGIEIITHMIIGLPGETDRMIYETAEYIGKSGVNGIKLQLLHVLANTDLADEYAAGVFSELSLDKYIDLLEGCIMRLPPDIVIHRLTGDGAKKDLIAPLWSANKKAVINSISSAFERDNVIQGSLFRKQT